MGFGLFGICEKDSSYSLIVYKNNQCSSQSGAIGANWCDCKELGVKSGVFIKATFGDGKCEAAPSSFGAKTRASILASVALLAAYSAFRDSANAECDPALPFKLIWAT